MGIGMSIRVETRDVRKRLRRLGKTLNTRQLLEAIGNRHLKWTNDNLRKAGEDTPHKQMSPNTLLIRPQRTSSSHFSSRYRSRLAQSFVSRVIGRSRVLVGTEEQFADFHHFGTEPFTIKPKSKESLRFRTTQGWVTKKEVQHPGIPSRPLLPTKAVAERLAVGVIEAVVDRATAEFNR